MKALSWLIKAQFCSLTCSLIGNPYPGTVSSDPRSVPLLNYSLSSDRQKPLHLQDAGRPSFALCLREKGCQAGCDQCLGDMFLLQEADDPAGKGRYHNYRYVLWCSLCSGETCFIPWFSQSDGWGGSLYFFTSLGILRILVSYRFSEMRTNLPPWSWLTLALQSMWWDPYLLSVGPRPMWLLKFFLRKVSRASSLGIQLTKYIFYL